MILRLPVDGLTRWHVPSWAGPKPGLSSPASGEAEPHTYNSLAVSDTQRIGGGSPDDLRKRFQILERVAIFFTLPDNILHALARRLAQASASKGTVIVHQGDPGDTMFVVESGRGVVFVG